MMREDRPGGRLRGELLAAALCALAGAAACWASRPTLGPAREREAAWPATSAEPAAEREPTIDGVLDEWPGAATVVQDDVGDATGVFDLSRVAVQARGTRLYVQFDISRELNLQAGLGDEGTLVLLVDLPDGRRLYVDFRNRFACCTDNPDQQIPWARLAFACLPTFAAKQYELRVDLTPLGARAGDTVKIQFAGSDRLREPISVVLPPAPRMDDQPTKSLRRVGDVRIANLNTFHEGLSRAPRSERIRRLLAAVDADICCFQEELREDLFRSGAERVVPNRGGAKLNTHWQGGCGIATRWPLQPLPLEFEPRFSRAQTTDRPTGVAAAVRLPGGRQLVVCALHLSCCGWADDARDRARVRETRQLARQLERLRRGEFGEALGDAPVVVIGDYNLVGSRQPLTTLESVGLTEYLLHGLIDRSACTWRGGPDESYWPGRLDLVTYDAGRLEPKNGFILNTHDLSDSMLADLGLRRDDSTASDHLLVVADFALRQ